MARAGSGEVPNTSRSGSDRVGSARYRGCCVRNLRPHPGKPDTEPAGKLLETHGPDVATTGIVLATQLHKTEEEFREGVRWMKMLHVSYYSERVFLTRKVESLEREWRPEFVRLAHDLSEFGRDLQNKLDKYAGMKNSSAPLPGASGERSCKDKRRVNIGEGRFTARANQHQ
jgi:hypothetical protein